MVTPVINSLPITPTFAAEPSLAKFIFYLKILQLVSKAYPFVLNVQRYVHTYSIED